MSRNVTPTITKRELRIAKYARGAWLALFASHLLAGLITALALVAACWVTPSAINPLAFYELPDYEWGQGVAIGGVLLLCGAWGGADNTRNLYVDNRVTTYSDNLPQTRSSARWCYLVTVFWGLLAGVVYVAWAAVLA